MSNGKILKNQWNKFYVILFQKSTIQFKPISSVFCQLRKKKHAWSIKSELDSYFWNRRLKKKREKNYTNVYSSFFCTDDYSPYIFFLFEKGIPHVYSR